MIYAGMRLVRKHPDVIVVSVGLVMAYAPWGVALAAHSKWIPYAVVAVMWGFSKEIEAVCGIIFFLGCGIAMAGAVRAIRRRGRLPWGPSLPGFGRHDLPDSSDPV